MQIENAVQATEVVKIFLEKMNPNMAFSPRKANLIDSDQTYTAYWLVEVTWGFQAMVFKVKKYDGQIAEYETTPTKVAKE